MRRLCRRGLVLGEHLDSMSDLGSILFVNGKFFQDHNQLPWHFYGVNISRCDDRIQSGGYEELVWCQRRV